jgi:hypothetical protein
MTDGEPFLDSWIRDLKMINSSLGRGRGVWGFVLSELRHVRSGQSLASG